MSETLLGVLMGGLIGWIAPLMTLRYGERRWKFEANVARLKAERDRFEALYEKTLLTLRAGMEERNYNTVMIADIFVVMPKEISDLFQQHMKEDDRSEADIKQTYLFIAAAMKRDLRARDDKIAELFQ